MGDRSETTDWIDFSDTTPTPVPPSNSGLLPPASLDGTSTLHIPQAQPLRSAFFNCLGEEATLTSTDTTPAFGVLVAKDQKRPSSAGFFAQTGVHSQVLVPVAPTAKPDANDSRNISRNAEENPIVLDANGTSNKTTFKSEQQTPSLPPMPLEGAADDETVPKPKKKANHLKTLETPSITSVQDLFDTLDTTASLLTPHSLPPLLPTKLTLVATAINLDSTNDDSKYFAPLSAALLARIKKQREELVANQRMEIDKYLFRDTSFEPLTENPSQLRERLAPPRVSFADTIAPSLRDSTPPEVPYTQMASATPTTAKSTITQTPACIPPILLKKLPLGFIPETTSTVNLRVLLEKAATSVRTTASTLLAKTSEVSTIISRVGNFLSSTTTAISSKLKQAKTWLNNENEMLLPFKKQQYWPTYVTPILIAATVGGSSLAAYHASHQATYHPTLIPDNTAVMRQQPTSSIDRQLSKLQTSSNITSVRVRLSPPSTVSVRVDGGTADSAVRYASHALGIPPTRPLIHQATEACAGTTGPTLLTISLDGGVNTPRVACRPRSPHQPVMVSQGQQKRKG